ncbi:MAG: hypothetical protein Q9226_004378 [Calogaya cf. arnoldii]
MGEELEVEGERGVLPGDSARPIILDSCLCKSQWQLCSHLVKTITDTTLMVLAAPPATLNLIRAETSALECCQPGAIHGLRNSLLSRALNAEPLSAPGIGPFRDHLHLGFSFNG